MDPMAGLALGARAVQVTLADVGLGEVEGAELLFDEGVPEGVDPVLRHRDAARGDGHAWALRSGPELEGLVAIENDASEGADVPVRAAAPARRRSRIHGLWRGFDRGVVGMTHGCGRHRHETRNKRGALHNDSGAPVATG